MRETRGEGSEIWDHTKGRDVKEVVKWGKGGPEHFAHCTTLHRATVEDVHTGGFGTVFLASWPE